MGFSSLTGGLSLLNIIDLGQLFDVNINNPTNGQVLTYDSASGDWINANDGGGTVTSVTNADGTITVSGTATAPVVSLALGHANAWTGRQTFNTSAAIFGVGTITPKIYPAADSTSAIQILKADGTTVVSTIDTTNGKFSIGSSGQYSVSSAGLQSLPDGTNAAAGLSFFWSADTDTGLYRPGANEISFVAGGAEKLNVVAQGLKLNGTGSATAPNIFWNGDSNTGIYTAGADTLALTTGGVAAIYIDTAQKVGFGTTTPKNTLMVQGATATNMLNFDVGNGSIMGSNVYYSSVFKRVTSGLVSLVNYNDGGAAGDISFYQAGTGIADSTISFGNPTLYLKNSNGFVGFGTTNPTTIVQVGTGSGSTVKNQLFWSNYQSSGGTTGYPQFMGNNTGSNYWGIGYSQDSTPAGALTFGFVSAVNTEWLSRVMTVGQTGLVGIGTIAPTNIFSLGGNAARIMWMERHTTADTAGNTLTLQAGGATSGATNKAGGNLILQPGASTGSGTSDIVLNTYPGTAGATSDNTALTALQLSGSTSRASKYGNVSTAGWGIPAIYGSGRSTAQTAAVASVAAYTVGASDGSFLISGNVNVTTSTTHSFSLQCDYTDETNTTRTITLNVQQLGGTLVTAITNITGAGPYEGVPLHIRCKASTSITIKTTGTFTSVTYNAEGMITQIS